MFGTFKPRAGYIVLFTLLIGSIFIVLVGSLLFSLEQDINSTFDSQQMDISGNEIISLRNQLRLYAHRDPDSAALGYIQGENYHASASRYEDRLYQFLGEKDQQFWYLDDSWNRLSGVQELTLSYVKNEAAPTVFSQENIAPELSIILVRFTRGTNELIAAAKITCLQPSNGTVSCTTSAGTTITLTATPDEDYRYTLHLTVEEWKRLFGDSFTFDFRNEIYEFILSTEHGSFSVSLQAWNDHNQLIQLPGPLLRYEISRESTAAASEFAPARVTEEEELATITHQWPGFVTLPDGATNLTTANAPLPPFLAMAYFDHFDAVNQAIWGETETTAMIQTEGDNRYLQLPAGFNQYLTSQWSLIGQFDVIIKWLAVDNTDLGGKNSQPTLRVGWGINQSLAIKKTNENINGQTTICEVYQNGVPQSAAACHTTESDSSTSGYLRLKKIKNEIKIYLGGRINPETWEREWIEVGSFAASDLDQVYTFGIKGGNGQAVRFDDYKQMPYGATYRYDARSAESHRQPAYEPLSSPPLITATALYESPVISYPQLVQATAAQLTSNVYHYGERAEQMGARLYYQVASSEDGKTWDWTNRPIIVTALTKLDLPPAKYYRWRAFLTFDNEHETESSAVESVVPRIYEFRLTTAPSTSLNNVISLLDSENQPVDQLIFNTNSLANPPAQTVTLHWSYPKEKPRLQEGSLIDADGHFTVSLDKDRLTVNFDPKGEQSATETLVYHGAVTVQLHDDTIPTTDPLSAINAQLTVPFTAYVWPKHGNGTSDPGDNEICDPGTLNLDGTPKAYAYGDYTTYCGSNSTAAFCSPTFYDNEVFTMACTNAGQYTADGRYCGDGRISDAEVCDGRQMSVPHSVNCQNCTAYDCAPGYHRGDNNSCLINEETCQAEGEITTNGCAQLGKCAGSHKTCNQNGEALQWGACSIIPDQSENCDNQTDDDCDGEINEGCNSSTQCPQIKNISINPISNTTWYNTSITVNWSVTNTPDSVTCSYTNNLSTPCTSPYTISNLINGSYPFTITVTKDGCEQATLSKQINYDKEDPICGTAYVIKQGTALIPIDLIKWHKLTEISISCSDNLSGCIQSLFTAALQSVATPSINSIPPINITDNAGNSISCSTNNNIKLVPQELTFYADYTDNSQNPQNADYAEGVNAADPTNGGYSINESGLKINQEDKKYISYPALNNLNSTEGRIEIMVNGEELKTAGYSYLFDMQNNNKTENSNRLSIYKDSTGSLRFIVYDSSGVLKGKKADISNITNNEVTIIAAWNNGTLNLSIPNTSTSNLGNGTGINNNNNNTSIYLGSQVGGAQATGYVCGTNDPNAKCNVQYPRFIKSIKIYNTAN